MSYLSIKIWSNLSRALQIATHPRMALSIDTIGVPMESKKLFPSGGIELGWTYDGSYGMMDKWLSKSAVIEDERYERVSEGDV